MGFVNKNKFSAIKELQESTDTTFKSEIVYLEMFIVLSRLHVPPNFNCIGANEFFVPPYFQDV